MDTLLKDAILFLIVAGSIIFVVRLLHFFLRRYGWLAEDRSIFYHVRAWVKRHIPFHQKPEPATPAPAEPTTKASPHGGTRAAKPQSDTYVAVWALLAILAFFSILTLMWMVDSLDKRQDALIAEVVEMRKRLVPHAALTTGMLAEPVEAANLTTRLDRDFGEISRRLEAIEEEPALKLTYGEVEFLREFLRENDWKLEQIIILASLTDTDNDGVVDTYDLWPTVPRGEIVVEMSEVDEMATMWVGGVPMTDTDEDNIRDAVDACPTEVGDDYDLDTVGGIPQRGETLNRMIPVAFYGCPDGDLDGIPDSVDLCPEAKADGDQNFDGCDDALQDLSKSGDHRWGAGPAYDDASGMLVGRFRAERTVGDVVLEFRIACEAMGADGAQLAKDADRSLVKSWGACRPVGR